MENHNVIAGKIHYFDWVIFKFANCNKLPEGKSEYRRDTRFTQPLTFGNVFYPQVCHHLAIWVCWVHRTPENCNLSDTWVALPGEGLDMIVSWIKSDIVMKCWIGL